MKNFVTYLMAFGIFFMGATAFSSTALAQDTAPQNIDRQSDDSNYRNNGNRHYGPHMGQRGYGDHRPMHRNYDDRNYNDNNRNYGQRHMNNMHQYSDGDRHYRDGRGYHHDRGQRHGSFNGGRHHRR